MKGMSWLLCVLQAVLLGTAIYTNSLYSLVCAAACLWLGLSRLLFTNAAALDTEKQRRKCRLSGLCMLPPAAGIAGLSVIQLYSQTDTFPARVEIYIVCGLTTAQAGILLLSITKKQAEKTIVGGVSRYFEIALLCALLPILVSRLLWFGAVDEWAQMVCLTGCVASGAILLLGANMLLCSLCGYRTTKESILLIKNFYLSKRRYFYFASVGKDGIMVLAKLILSIASRSFFMFANALFSCGIGLARYTALQMKDKDQKVKLKLFRRVTVILSFAGLCYGAILYDFSLGAHREITIW